MRRFIRRLRYGNFTTRTFEMIDARDWYAIEDREAFRRTLREIINAPEISGVPPIRMTMPQ